MADRASIIEQVKKLLALGDSQFEEEARTSLFLAHKKMREHGITYGDLNLPPGGGNTLSEDDLIALQGEAIVDYMRAIGSNGGHARARSLTKAEKTEIAYQGVEARMKKVSAKRRKDIAERAAKARWGSK